MAYKKPPTKADLRKKLDEEVGSYLDQGGKVKAIPTGQSGRDNNTPVKPVLFDSPKESRTYVNDVVASIDERKKPRKPDPKVKRDAPSGKYKIIYDDFGEPVRKVWVEE